MIEQEVNEIIEAEIEPVERVITAKKASELSQEEIDYLVENAKKGIEHDVFDVKFYKNGNHKVVLKRAPKKTTAQKVIETRAPVMTNDQLLMEHVIDLESRFKAIEMKHKRLKKKYKGLKQDLYIDVEEEEAKPVEEVKPIDPEPVIPYHQPLRGWRSRISRQ